MFSVKHMRGLVPIFDRVTQRVSSTFGLQGTKCLLCSQLCSALSEKLKGGAPTQEVNVNEWASRTALEFIAQGGLGTSLDPLVDGETSSYTKLSKQLV